MSARPMPAAAEGGEKTVEMRRYVEIKPVVIEGFPDARNVFLRVGSQSFCVTKYGCETPEDAEWVAGQLAIALANIVRESQAGAHP